jgi:hypothetical protein
VARKKWAFVSFVSFCGVTVGAVRTKKPKKSGQLAVFKTPKWAETIAKKCSKSAILGQKRPFLAHFWGFLRGLKSSWPFGRLFYYN